MLLVTSENLHTALHNGVRFQRLTHLFGSLDLNITEHQIYLDYQPVQLDTHLGHLRAQCEISGTYKFLQVILELHYTHIPGNSTLDERG